MLNSPDFSFSIKILVSVIMKSAKTCVFIARKLYGCEGRCNGWMNESHRGRTEPLPHFSKAATSKQGGLPRSEIFKF